MKTRSLLMCASLAALAACGGGGDGSSGTSTTTPTTPSYTISSLLGGTLPTGGIIGTLPDPWNRYFVTTFDTAKVAALRASEMFQNSWVQVSLQISGHPIYDSAKTVTTNAQIAAKLDYALSTGLTGKGETVAMIDNRINTAHEQFYGKTITTYGYGTNPSPDFHGTAVASIMTAGGINGGMVGVAPGASLYAGYIDYNAAIDWSALANAVNGAKAAGAIALNNSWGLSGETYQSFYYNGTFSKTVGGAEFLTALRNFAKTGIIVFAAQNVYTDTSINAMAAMPARYSDLQSSWITAINVLPTLDSDGNITGATRLSAPCAETAQYCLDADGLSIIADYQDTSGYLVGLGASFAAPQVTGALALLAQAFPTLTPQQLRDRLLATANNSFYTHTGTVTFAPGVTHGYNDEYGMGFLDLKAALLPIGKVYTPTATGGEVALGTAALAGSTASGNAIALGLAKTRILSEDALGGIFQAKGSVVAGTPRAANVPGQLARAMSGRVLGVRRGLSAGLSAPAGSATAFSAAAFASEGLMEAPDAIALSGLRKVAAVTRGDTTVSLIEGSEGPAGLALTTALPFEGGALELGLTGFRDTGSVLGITAPAGGTVSAWTSAVSLGLAARLGQDTGLRIKGEFGVTRGKGTGGLLAGFTPVRYSSVGISLDRANAFTRGDLLSVFVRQPISITSGAAVLVLPTGYTASGFSFSDAPIALSPEQRELDTGIEYSAPLGHGLEIAAGLAYRQNAGNIEGRRGIDATAMLRFSF